METQQMIVFLVKKGKLLCKYFPTAIQTAVSAKFVIEDKVRNTVF